ncbi:nucleotidyltransferase domain-containing protein [Segetibacter sp. 3557_3]|uniref:aminoglycoside 6-adenylyltransferase n=1 Tax=Segetibacter sp. 3557_3 TaxID=2547429 RepID=UPI001058FB47|nr:aminoglycoside 6-adenylyltransferase [Segetibacter sp. 3557_3]TDH26937.1 nucleotidyltransferase domain-containing protein [Segetibacter sp. 3557_3]
MNIQEQFANRVVEVIRLDKSVVGLAVAGSWLTSEIDAFSDLDLVLVANERISDDKYKMLNYAKRFGHFLSGFTGEHVGEPRVLICLYKDPLLHVDIKFVTVDEFRERIETPILLLDKEGQLKSILEQTEPKFPYPDYQWIEDRFWIWVHYALLKIGRGEYVEAFDFFGFLRMVVLGPLLHIKNGNLPRGVRKVETQLPLNDFAGLKATLPTYCKSGLLDSLQHSVGLYRELREALFPATIILQTETEGAVMNYFEQISNSPYGELTTEGCLT